MSDAKERIKQMEHQKALEETLKEIAKQLKIANQIELEKFEYIVKLDTIANEGQKRYTFKLIDDLRKQISL